jgi:tRNA threonylcarbamoyladenosine biosynthesis protein TsaE
MAELILKETDLPMLAAKIVRHLGPGDVLALEGELAAGKTALTREIVRALGYWGPIASPTFVIERRYPLNQGAIKQIIHLDFYRLSPEQIKELDWGDYLDPASLTIIEWPEAAAALLPSQVKTVTINKVDEYRRRFHLADDLVAGHD